MYILLFLFDPQPWGVLYNSSTWKWEVLGALLLFVLTNHSFDLWNIKSLMRILFVYRNRMLRATTCILGEGSFKCIKNTQESRHPWTACFIKIFTLSTTKFKSGKKLQGGFFSFLSFVFVFTLYRIKISSFALYILVYSSLGNMYLYTLHSKCSIVWPNTIKSHG